MTSRITGILAVAGALSALPAAASEGDFVRRAGEWDVSISAGLADATPQRYMVCYSRDSSILDKLRRDTASCPDQRIAVDGDTLRVDAICRMERDAQLTIHSSVTASGADAFHGNVTVRYDHMPAGFDAPDKTITAEERRVGPCQPGDRPR